MTTPTVNAPLFGQTQATFLMAVESADVKTRLILLLAHLNRGTPNLLVTPPEDGDSLLVMRVGVTAADRELREWINRIYRKPGGWPPIPRGGLPTSTTIGKLVTLCTKEK
jgi:transcription termination factor Rho